MSSFTGVWRKPSVTLIGHRSCAKTVACPECSGMLPDPADE